MRKMTRMACERIANQILDKYKVKHPKIFEQLSKAIEETGGPVQIKLSWDSKVEDLKFEVVG